MKKWIAEDKVQRMRNLITGDYDAKTKLRIGFETKTNKKSEGDVWEEKGRTWTIKNGLKQTINKMDEYRKKMSMPLKCPSCSKKMKWFDKHAYNHFNHCSDCLVIFECEIQKKGLWEEYKRKIQDANFRSWLKESTEEFKDYLRNRNNKTYVTEAGDIEDWGGGQSDKEIKQAFDKAINKIVENRKQNRKKGDK